MTTSPAAVGQSTTEEQKKVIIVTACCENTSLSDITHACRSTCKLLLNGQNNMKLIKCICQILLDEQPTCTRSNITHAIIKTLEPKKSIIARDCCYTWWHPRLAWSPKNPSCSLCGTVHYRRTNKGNNCNGSQHGCGLSDITHANNKETPDANNLQSAGGLHWL